MQPHPAPITSMPACIYHPNTHKVQHDPVSLARLINDLPINPHKNSTITRPTLLTHPHSKPITSHPAAASQLTTTSLLCTVASTHPMDANSMAAHVEQSLSITQVGLSSTDHNTQQLASKILHEQLASKNNITIKKYHTNNGVFASQAFQQACAALNQSISFSGVGTHHQNGTVICPAWRQP